MWSIVDASALKPSIEYLQQLRRTKNTKGVLVQWHKASDSKRPALVFIPGFLTAQAPNKPFEKWTSQITDLAKYYDMAAYGLYWPSAEIADLLKGDAWTRTLCSFSTFSPSSLSVLSSSLLSPAVTAPILGLGVPTLLNALKTWKKTVAYADIIGKNPDSWLESFDRPVVVLGHSLGGRMAIYSAIHTKSSQLKQVYAMAPAVLPQNCHFEQISKSLHYKVGVLYSENDAILKYLFRLAEMTLKAPLGLDGGPTECQDFLTCVDANRLHNRQIGHQDYSDCCLTSFKGGTLGMQFADLAH